MLNKKICVIFSVVMATLMPTSVFALDSDLQYNFCTENSEEYYKTGISNVNFNGQIPDYIQNIYDLTPQQTMTSEYGATIIAPNMSPTTNQTTYAPTNAPVSIVSSIGNGNAAAQNGGFGSSTMPSIQENTTIPEQTYNGGTQYPLTSIEEVRKSDGSIGTLKIPKIDLRVTAYDGDTYEAMKKGIGHISSTSAWNGNMGFVGHNRGANDYFGKLKNLSIGDEISYQTNFGTKYYIVESVTRISETDWSKLEYTMDNRITLLTCVEDVPNERLCVQAREKT